jgi:hypothetical protein
MPLVCNTDHSKMTLEEIYIDLSKTSTNSYADVGREMLRLVQFINEIFKDTSIWGLTSHDRLVLQNADDWESPWYVIVANIGTKEYYFEYLLPTDKQPWEIAYVRGQANTFDEAKRYLLIAMNESEGWANNNELKRLLALIDLKKISGV